MRTLFFAGLAALVLAAVAHSPPGQHDATPNTVMHTATYQAPAVSAVTAPVPLPTIAVLSAGIEAPATMPLLRSNLLRRTRDGDAALTNESYMTLNPVTMSTGLAISARIRIQA